MKKKFGLLHTLNMLMITALVLAACAQATPTAAPEQATQASSTAVTTSPPATAAPTSSPAELATSPSANPKAPAYWPTQDWRTSTPEQQGMDSAQISKMFDFIQMLHQNVHSVIIVRNGYIVTEAYYSPFRPDARHNLQSDTTNIVSILIGIAIQEGYIKGVDQKMVDFFTDRKIANLDARKQAITIENLLTLTSGLLSDSDGLFASDDGVQFALDPPMTIDPGKMFNDVPTGYHLLSAIINKATGMTSLVFANKYLFGPLGITGAGWIADPKGINYGGSLLYITSRDMAKIGYLYLNNGEWNGKQIVPKEYVLTSAKPLSGPTHTNARFGYGWTVDSNGSYYAQGDYGQLIYIKPDQGIVIVFTGGEVIDDLSIKNLIDNFILPAVKSAGPLPENPASTALLSNKIAAIEKPASQPIPPLPKIAQTISGKKYLLEDGEGFTLTFAGDQATLDWSFKDQSMHFPIGMDNVFRTTPIDQTENLSLFGAIQPTLGHIFLAFKGNWTSDGNFILTLQILNSTKSHTMSFSFSEDKVNIIHSQTDSSDTLTFQGQVQSP